MHQYGGAMMAKRKAYKYTGVLNEPIQPYAYRRNALAKLNASDHERAKVEYRRQYRQRIEALAKDCNTDGTTPGMWVDIALTLAERHVAGFTVAADFRRPAPVGRPTWRASKDLPLVNAMDEHRARKHSIRRAAQLVAKERGEEEKWRGLDRRYRRFEERTKDLDGPTVRHKKRKALVPQ
jgi:hypothetical protein